MPMSGRIYAVVAAVGVALSSTLSSPPIATADSLSFASGGPIDVRDTVHVFDDAAPIALTTEGAASRYPAQITVADLPGVVTDVDVELFGLAHDRPDDLDIMLVGPTGRSVVLLSDAGGGGATDLPYLALDDEAPAPAADAGPLGGDVRPSDINDGPDTWPAPAPAPGGTSTLSSLDGTAPNGTWQLFVVDDTSGATGNITEGWALWIETAPSTSPFPSIVKVSGLPRGITDVDVTLRGLTHDYAADLDVRLVAPDGTSVTLVSDVSEGQAVNDATVTLDDEAPGPLPADSTLVSGRYSPRDIDGGSDPGPDLPAGASQLLAFDGKDPNGSWQLFIADDDFGFEGRLGSWSLAVTTVNLPAAPEITYPTYGLAIRSANITVSGRAQPNNSVVVSVGETRTEVRAAIDGTWTAEFTRLPSRWYLVRAYVRDAFGNNGPASDALVTLDLEPPTGTLSIRALTGTDGRTNRRQVLLNIGASDSPGGGIAGVRLSNDGETFGPLRPLESPIPWTLGDRDGVRRVFLQVEDAVGNVSSGYVSSTIVLDQRAPRVSRVWPRAGASGSRRDVTVRARMNETVGPAYVNPGSAVLYRAGSQRPVRAVVRYDRETRTISIHPVRRLAPRTTYRAVITTVVRDVAGNPLDQDLSKPRRQAKVWRFTTR